MPDGKKLYLMRHADAAWPKSGQHDFDRPLTDIGKMAAQEMGRRLKERTILPDLIFSSPARRATQTAELIACELGIPTTTIIFDEQIYEATVSDLLDIIHGIDDRIGSAMLIGHNPSLTWAINKITQKHITNAPTGAVATIGTLSNNWKGLISTQAELVDFAYP
jgi:phosphohistidine phosphatase